MTSRYQLHVDHWKDCTACHLHETRQHVVLARGKLPCDVLFVGEAPGRSEDVLGQPFVGPAGHLLTHIVSKSVPEEVRVAYTNIISCIPLDDEGDKTAEPPVESIEACSPRLREMIALARPKLIICVGAISRDWVDWKTKLEATKVHITHPAAILKANLAHKGLLVQRCIVTVRNAVAEMLAAT